MMIDEKPEDPAKPKADTLMDYMTGRRPPPWKRRRNRKRKRTLGDQPDNFRSVHERATAGGPDAPEKTKETP